MIYIRVWDASFKEWRALPEPLHITEDQLRQARAEFRKQASEVDDFGEVPQTRARAILAKICPDLRGLDMITAGFAVTNPRIEVDGKKWKKDPVRYKPPED